MEFKKANRYSRRPGQDVAPRGVNVAYPQPNRRIVPATTFSQTQNTPIVQSPAEPEPSATPHTRRIFSSKKILVIAAIIVIAGSGFLAVKLFRPDVKEVATAPTYQTILPEKKSISELGGWKRVSPPDQAEVFAYSDVINGVPISISQQPLPQTFQNNTDSQVAELARKFNATTKIDADGTTVYIGTSAKGPQSAILAKQDLLIMIKSEKKITDVAWASYAKSLN